MNYTKQDPLIYTDGSQEYSEDKLNYENVASIGIYIKFNNSEYRILQPIGNQTILFAEQYALALIPKLLGYNRILIFIDNLPTYFTIYRKNIIPLYPTLIHSIQHYINSKTLVFKVKSHNEKDPINGNNIADSLANQASEKNYIISPRFTPCFTCEYPFCAHRNLWG